MAEILSSELCGCFYCLSTFDPSQIDDWIDEDASGTAMCPSCGVDSVIGSASGYTIDPLFLTAMRAHWF